METASIDRDRKSETPTLDTLLARANQLGPVLAANRAAAETRGALTDAALEALRVAGMLKLWRPRSLGGLEIEPNTYASVAEQIASHDPAAAFLMMAANNAAFDLRLADGEFVESIYRANPDALVCASFNRALPAEPRADGFVVHGEVPFASGCRHAQWIGHTAIVCAGGEPVKNPDGAPRMLLVYHPAASLQIVDDWDSLGLRGTSSNTVRVEQLFVPRARVVELSADWQIGRHHRGPLYRCPIALLSASLAPVALGALRAALGCARELAGQRVAFAERATLAHRPRAQAHYGRALATHRAARAHLHEQLERSWQRALAGERFTLTDKADLILATTHTVQQCTDAVRELATLAGTAAIHKSCPIEQALRDTEVLRHHALVSEGRYASVAQIEFELPVDFPLMAMD